MRVQRDEKIVTVAGLNTMVVALNYQLSDQARLVGVTIEEYDSNGGGVADICSVHIQIQGTIGYLLHTDFMAAGVAIWQGEVPLAEPNRVVIGWADAAVNSRLICTIAVATGEEKAGGSPVRNVARIIPYGNLLLKSGGGVATEQTLAIRPPSGKRWEVVDLWSYHDDVSLNLFYSWTGDGTNWSNLMDSGLVAANVQVPYSNPVRATAVFGGYNLSLSYGTYLRINSIAAPAAGKKLYYVAIVRESTQD